tara:strand:- start:279 stop:491 length:213 start_codon:yes stop_codon:yes gene_type:complete
MPSRKTIDALRRKRLYNSHVSALENVSIEPLTWEEFKRVYREANQDGSILSNAVRRIKEKRIAHRWLDQT